MGDEQGTTGTEPGAGNVDDGSVHHGSHDGMQVWVVDGKGEQRGHWRLQLVTPVGQPLQAAHAGLTASGDGHKVVVSHVAELTDRVLRQDVDAQPTGFAQQAVDNGL